MYTQNQTRHFLVVDSNNQVAISISDEGDVYVSYQRDNGTVQRIDLLRGGMNDIAEATVTYSDMQQRRATAYVVKLDGNYLSNGNVINGQDYMLNINVRQYYFKSDLIDTWKHGVVHAAGNMSESDFYKRMALSLVANFSREPWPILKFGLMTEDGGSREIDWVGENTKFEDLNNDPYVGIWIEEAQQDWHLGKMEQEPVLFSVHCDNIIYSGDEVTWGTAEKTTGKRTIGNGRKIADMEWFYHGERGDIYREMAYPNNFDNVGVANPGVNYNTIDIHYFWQGANHAVQKSEKDITIAIPENMEDVLNVIQDRLVAAGISVKEI